MLLLFAALLPSLQAHPVRAERDAPPAELVERARAALGVDIETPPVTLKGLGSARGATGRFTLVLADDGRMRSTLATRLPNDQGYDGRSTWLVDWNGVARTLDLGEHEAALAWASLLTGRWCAEGEPLRLVAAPETDAERAALGFVSPSGHLRGVVVLDPRTSLPLRARWTVGSSVTRVRFQRWSRGPRRWPLTVERTTDGAPSSFLVEVEPGAEEVTDATFKVPRPTSLATFDTDVAPELRTVRAPTGHLLVQPRIDGREIGWFIFDTGAGANCLDRRAVEELGLADLGRIAAQGIGGQTPTTFHRATTLELGPMRVEGPTFVELDLSFLDEHFGRRTAGIIGYGVFARCVFEYEPATPYLALHDAATFQLPKGATWSKLALYQRQPVVLAEVEGFRGHFNVDSGATLTAMLHAPFTRRSGLLDGRDVERSISAGVGGTIEVLRGEVEQLLLAGRDLGPLEVGFARTEIGAYADPYLAGSLGAGLLGSFRVVFDYPNRRFAFLELVESGAAGSAEGGGDQESVR